MNVIFVLLGYLILINLVGFTAMFLDKRRARRGAFRIPESTLFTIAFMGGSLGSLIVMYLFHHKTRHRSFTVGIPLLLILQLFILIFLYLSPVQFKFL